MNRRDRLPRSLRALLVAALFLLLAAPAQADVIVPTANFAGACSVATGCLTATDGWQTDNATVYYLVTPNFGAPGVYRYQYIFGDGDLSNGDGASLPKAISHTLLELSANITDANFAEVILSHSAIDEALVEEWGDEGGSAPGIPGLLHGIKFTAQGASVIFELTSLRVPVWGDFYAKDGVDAGLDVYAFNSGFGTDPASGPLGVAGWIPVPDTTTVFPPPPPPPPAPVSQPAALLLVGAALLAGSGVRVLRRRV